MKQPIKAVMLPTEDKSYIYTLLGNQLPTVYLGDYDYSDGILRLNQHLYITVSQDVEPIKEGDWCIIYNEIGTNMLVQFNGGKYFHKFDSGNGYNTEEEVKGRVNKIIATTDPKLRTEKISYKIGTVIDRNPIPQLQQSFLKAFVESGGKEDWEVEYETKGHVLKWDRLKLDLDNCVILSAVEEKMIPLSEVKKLCKTSWQVGFNVGYNDETSPSHLTADDWIKENL